MYLKIVIYIFVSFFLLPLTERVRAQERIEGGFLLGTSYYIGDLNPGGHFYNARPAFGTLVRVAFNKRLAFKGSLTAVSIKGSYPREDVFFPTESGQQSVNYNFQRTLVDMATQLEINFFEYNNPFRKDETSFTPYISAGLGYTVYTRYLKDENSNSENPQFILSLPFGIGVKWKPLDWVHVGMEWTFSKTFVDDLDAMGYGEIDPSNPYGFKESSNLHNNDWYSYAGVFITFDLFHRSIPCHAGY